MKILVDTCVWSLALRRKDVGHDPFVAELEQLIQELRVQLIGPIRQEILSGIREPAKFELLRAHLRAFPDLSLASEDYELAAEFFNNCRGHGIQGSHVDFLICAVSVRHNLPILTTDDDFRTYARHVPLKLHPLCEGGSVTRR
jgi:predicted nucleic acid-binding protein